MDLTEDIEIDNTREDQAYWESILEKFGLGVNAGFRHRHESPRGGLNKLVMTEEIEARKSTGKSRPQGRGPTKDSVED